MPKNTPPPAESIADRRRALEELGADLDAETADAIAAEEPAPKITAALYVDDHGRPRGRVPAESLAAAYMWDARVWSSPL